MLPEGVDSANPIAADRAARARLDYLALGDWHGCRRMDERSWYAGTPETDRFKANDSGQALLVSMDWPGATPAVEVIAVGRYRWQQLESNLTVSSDVEETLRKLEQIGADDVVQLRLSGVCDLVGQRQLDSGVEAARARSRAMLLDAQDLSLAPTQADMEAIHADGYVGEVLQQLRTEQSEPQGALARDALLILARLLDGQAKPSAAKNQGAAS